MDDLLLLTVFSAMWFAAVVTAVVWFLFRRNPRVRLIGLATFIGLTIACTTFWYGEPEFTGPIIEDVPLRAPPPPTPTP